jgi:hypothetical protein
VQQGLDQVWTAASDVRNRNRTLLHADQRMERTTAAFEKAAILFNLGAALSADAAAADLTSDAGCKRAARRYQVPHCLPHCYSVFCFGSYATWALKAVANSTKCYLQTAVAAH